MLSNWNAENDSAESGYIPINRPLTETGLPAGVETTFHFEGKLMSQFFPPEGTNLPILASAAPSGSAFKCGFASWKADSISRLKVWNPHC
jgi:hypothetical protein